jgi:NADPH:quinone reductase-like Zn-dependent oxidoreductase
VIVYFAIFCILPNVNPTTTNRSGCTVITTCSPRNFRFVQGLGASKSFNYKDPECGSKIRAYTQDKLTKAIDTISEGSSPEICCEAISSAGGKITYLQPVTHSRTDVEGASTLAYSVTGEAFNMGPTAIPARPEDLEFGVR